MAFYPSIFNDVFHDPFFDDFFRPAETKSGMKTVTISSARCDIKDFEDRYEIEAELPGYTKEDVKVSLNDSTLVIEAEKNASNDTQDENGKYIRRERFNGKIRRAFGVGSNVRMEDISAAFKDGILTVTISKRDPEIEKKEHYIAIEG